jgi:short-subunit dehydrogenase
MARNTHNSVVVITGASSGIGRATALEFAKEGAKVVLASRDKNALKEVAAECEDHGGEPLVVQTDVTSEGEVENLARKATGKFGRIDVWVNNAGVGLYSRFEDTPREAYIRLLDTDLLGVIRGARVAIRQFRKQGDGTLINVSSQVAIGGFPYNSYYGVAKFGVRALGNMLRQELLGTNIHVSTVMPASTDTPFFKHAANYMGRAVQPIGSIDTAERVAQEIVEVARNPKREVMVAKTGHALGVLATMAPKAYDRVIRRKTEKSHFREERAPGHAGNLFKSQEPFETTGRWREKKQSAGSKLRPILTVAAGGAGLAWLLLNRRATHHRHWQRWAA